MIKGDNILSVGTPAGGGISIIANDPVTSGGGGGGDSPPITTDLLVYYNPEVEAYSDAGTTLAVDGDNVRQFNDQSGNSNTLTQTAASLQPIYRTSIFGNGNASLETISTDHLDLDSILNIADGASFTFYLVYKKTSSTSSGNVYILGGSDNTRFWLRNSQYAMYNSTNQSAVTSISEDTDLKFVTVVVDGSVPLTTFYVNGSSVGTATRDFIADFNFQSILGVAWSSAATAINCGNILMYESAHDATQVGQISDWLNDKYQIY